MFIYDRKKMYILPIKNQLYFECYMQNTDSLTITLTFRFKLLFMTMNNNRKSFETFVKRLASIQYLNMST